MGQCLKKKERKKRKIKGNSFSYGILWVWWTKCFEYSKKSRINHLWSWEPHWQACGRTSSSWQPGYRIKSFSTGCILSRGSHYLPTIKNLIDVTSLIILRTSNYYNCTIEDSCLFSRVRHYIQHFGWARHYIQHFGWAHNCIQLLKHSLSMWRIFDSARHYIKHFGV